MAELTVSLQINEIFENNKIKDLKRFMKYRKNYNKYNIFLIYLFHIIQTAGILTTTIATGYNDKSFILLGVALNCFASLIHIFEKTNSDISNKLFKDIKAIKNNNYIDESDINTEITLDNKNNIMNVDNNLDNNVNSL